MAPNFRPLLRGVLVAALASALVAPAASASNLIDRDATGVKLAVDRSGKALLTYRAAGKLKHVLAWGAVNAHAPTRARPQREFTVDYSGGWKLSHKLPLLWERFKNVCGPYRGPELAWLVTACTAPDGTHWAVQSWQRMLPNYGLTARDASLNASELRLSHWQGDLPVFTVKQDWAYRRYENIYGSVVYRGQPMYGFGTTQYGAPTDNYGVLVYVDTRNSAYGAGWRRENSFVTHRNTGVFCYGFFPHGRNPSGSGDAYRATAVGPGVFPDLFWQGKSRGAFDEALDLLANADQQQNFTDRLCAYK
ncbi:MAG: hypothetical protein ABR521_08780 [Gaiellaceae bacterium]